MRSCYPCDFLGVHPCCLGEDSPRTRASLEEMRVDSTGGLWTGSVVGRDDVSGHPCRPLCGDSAFDAPFLECWPVGAGLSVQGRRAGWQREGGRGRRIASLAKSMMPPLLCARQGAPLGPGQPYLPGCGAEAPCPAWRGHLTASQSPPLGWGPQRFALETEGPTRRTFSKISKQTHREHTILANISANREDVSLKMEATALHRGREAPNPPNFKGEGLHRGAPKPLRKQSLRKGAVA